jgi:flagellar biogenesis protein FliO
MPGMNSLIDYLTLGSDRPMRRLAAYYAALALVTVVLVIVFPPVAQVLAGGRESPGLGGQRLLTDALGGESGATSLIAPGSLLELATMTTLALIGTLALMLPVSWVYMSARRDRNHRQSVAQALIILPIVIAGVVFIVRDSLALALSLAGVVAAVRFRTTLRDARDSVFIFLAIAVGFAAGVQVLAVGALVSVVFNVVILVSWRYDFGRNLLERTSSAHWTAPLDSLAVKNGNGDSVPDRDLVLALTPQKVNALAKRFDRVRDVVGKKKKRPRYNAVLSFKTSVVGEAQSAVERALENVTRRWKLDEVVNDTGKPSEVYYLVRIGKSMSRDEFMTAVHAQAGDLIAGADLTLAELAEDLA